MSPRSLPASLALALSIAACAKPADQAAAVPAVDSAAVTAGVADLWQRWGVADTAGNVPALMAMIEDSARVDVRGAPPMIGKAEIQGMFDMMFKTYKYTSFAITPDMTVPITNELAYQNGNFVEGNISGGKAATEYGRYAAALRKGADGQWRFAYIMVFADSSVSKK